MESKIRIGFDAKRAYCNYRGLGNYSRLIIEGLVKWASGETELCLFTPKVNLAEYRNWPSSDVNRIEPQGIERLAPELWRGYLQTRSWAQHNLDLYHGLSHDLPLTGQTKTKYATKLVVTIHDLIFMRHPELYPAWDCWTYRKKVEHSCRLADSIVAISEQTKNDLIELLNVPEKKITVLYQAIHPRYYKAEQPKGTILERPQEQPYFLYVGALEERKNITRLMNAFAQVAHRGDHQLVLVGKGGLKAELQGLAHKLGVQAQVRILTDVGSHELPSYYQGATALVYPSLFEGFGLPIVEGLLSETLVITSKGSCFPEAGGSGAFYIDPMSEDELAQQMSLVLTLSTEERATRVSKGMEHAKKFHWQATTGQLLNHYRDVLASTNK